MNTSASYAEPSGFLAAYDVASHAQLATCDLGGQPSVAKAPAGSFLAIAVETERDEEAGDGDGSVGQMQAGNLVTIGIGDVRLHCDSLVPIDLTGLAEVAPEDPAPKYVDINGEGEIVVTLQENNYMVAVARDGEVPNHLASGSVTLDGIDAAEPGGITFNAAQQDMVRGPTRRPAGWRGHACGNARAQPARFVWQAAERKWARGLPHAHPSRCSSAVKRRSAPRRPSPRPSRSAKSRSGAA